AGHHQPRGAAAEQGREHAAEVLVDLAERLLQQLARLEVDLADRVFQRADRLLQIGVLRVEELLALARTAELLERGQVDRAERGDLAAEAIDLRLQAREAHAAVLDAARQRVELDLR